MHLRVINKSAEDSGHCPNILSALPLPCLPSAWCLYQTLYCVQYAVWQLPCPALALLYYTILALYYIYNTLLYLPAFALPNVLSFPPPAPVFIPFLVSLSYLREGSSIFCNYLALPCPTMLYLPCTIHYSTILARPP